MVLCTRRGNADAQLAVRYALWYAWRPIPGRGGRTVRYTVFLWACAYPCEGPKEWLHHGQHMRDLAVPTPPSLNTFPLAAPAKTLAAPTFPLAAPAKILATPAQLVEAGVDEVRGCRQLRDAFEGGGQPALRRYPSWSDTPYKHSAYPTARRACLHTSGAAKGYIIPYTILYSIYPFVCSPLARRPRKRSHRSRGLRGAAPAATAVMRAAIQLN